MASIRREVSIAARPEPVWAAVRDVGNIHVRLVPGFVIDCRMEGDIRIVTFANGMVVREPIVDIDEDQRRVAWAAVKGQFEHYNASLQVFAEGGGSHAPGLDRRLVAERVGGDRGRHDRTRALGHEADARGWCSTLKRAPAPACCGEQASSKVLEHHHGRCVGALILRGAASHRDGSKGAAPTPSTMEARVDIACERILRQAIEVAVFAQAVKELWEPAPWRVIEGHAAREWSAIEWPSGPRAWRDVRAFVREVWLEDED